MFQISTGNLNHCFPLPSPSLELISITERHLYSKLVDFSIIGTHIMLRDQNPRFFVASIFISERTLIF